MGFFSEADLDEIRADPTSIVDLYAARGSDFIAALDMPDLSANAYMAAFSTVLAYELAPYGDEPNTYDVTELANAPSLACDRYVTLAWELSDLLGVPDTDGTAVGWYGGVVGNHAQLLFNDGQTQLLLDPTIGLIASGVTYAGLINGDHYVDLTSFYSRDDITDFNTQVIAAVENGSYQVWDTVYYTPGLDEWEYNYFGHLGVTVDNGNGSESVVGTAYSDFITGGSGDDWIYGSTGDDTLDGGAGVDTAVYRSNFADNTVSFGGDGSVVVTGADGTDTLTNIEILQFADQKVVVPFGRSVDSDTSNSFVWDTIVTSTAYDRLPIEISYYYDDGSSWIYQYDPLGLFNWDRIQTSVDGDSNVTQVLYDEDDGTHVMYQYDPNNSANWSRITTYLKSDYSAAIRTLYDEDDGTHVMYEYDVSDTGTWNSIATYFTSSYATLSQLYNQDDGTYVLYQYDVNSIYSWKVLQTNYDASFHPVSQVLTNDDGTRSVLEFDASNQLVSAHTYDASWHLIA